jgi:hypothetical protein
VANRDEAGSTGCGKLSNLDKNAYLPGSMQSRFQEAACDKNR